MADKLYDIKKVIIEELDPLTGLVKSSNPITVNLDTAEEADLEALVSEGEEKILRSDSVIMAVARTPDLFYGYNVKLKDITFDVTLASLIEGGTIRRDGGNNIIGYDSSKLADGATMKPFRTILYIANYEGDSITNYVKLTLTNCIGKATKLGFKKDFFAPEFEIKARENTLAGLATKLVDYVSALPTDDTTAPTYTRTGSGSIEIPAPLIGSLNELGTIYLVPSSATITTIAQLQNIVSAGLGKYGTMLSANVDVSIATTGLSAGEYKAYGVDLAGNISTGTAVTLIDES